MTSQIAVENILRDYISFVSVRNNIHLVLTLEWTFLSLQYNLILAYSVVQVLVRLSCRMTCVESINVYVKCFCI